MTIRFIISTAALLCLAALAPVALQTSAVRAQPAGADPLSRDAVLRDPDIPVLGNPDGDITIVEYFDYQCPYCRKVNPDLQKVVREDGHIRLVFKDWPVFGAPSVYAAKLALAAKYQGKYREAHEALIGLKEKLTESNVVATLTAAGIDVDRAERDLATNQATIDALLARNDTQAVALGFRGTPAFIIGRFRVPGALDLATFKQAVADARLADKRK